MVSTAQIFSKDPAAQPAIAPWSTLIFPSWILESRSKWIIPGTSINIGNFLSAIINFLILAFIIFCVVKGLNKLNDKFKKKVEEEVTPAGPTQEELLAEIRDLLKDKE